MIDHAFHFLFMKAPPRRRPMNPKSLSLSVIQNGYLFETEGAANWMGRHFFTGGMMPSEDLFSHFGEHLTIEQRWRVSGLHYWRTCEEWLKNADRNRVEILARFQQDLSPREAKVSFQRWRIFFLACAELFRYRGGEEWFVAHYLFQPTTHATNDEPVKTNVELASTLPIG